MTPKAQSYDGPERRKYSNDFEREVFEFMARVDQRNEDRDIQTAAREEVAVDHETRICSLEHSRTWLKGVLWTAPALATVAGIFLKIGQMMKMAGGTPK